MTSTPGGREADDQRASDARQGCNSASPFNFYFTLTDEMRADGRRQRAELDAIVAERRRERAERCLPTNS